MFRSKLFLFVLTLVVLVTAQSYNFQVTITCVENSTGYCTKWQQNGSISQATTSCFPASATVMRQDGVLVRMDKLTIGDHILAYNPSTGKQEFSEIIAWLHRDPLVNSSYIGIQAQSDILWISPQHNIAIMADENVKYIHASEVILGNKLIGNSNFSTAVNSIKHATILNGVYAPYTRLANFYVGTTNATYLAHSFAYIRNPTVYELPFAASMWLAEYINPSIHVVEDTTSQYFHPVARILQKIFPFLVNIPSTSSREYRFNVKDDGDDDDDDDDGNSSSSSNEQTIVEIILTASTIILTSF